jgi:hypothetical protein
MLSPMMRSGLLTVALALLLSGSAASAQTAGGVVPVARTAGELELALSGTQLLVARHSGRGVRLQSVPVAGGKARMLFSRAAGPRRIVVMNALDASSERVVFSLVVLNPATEGVVRASVWAGPPEGPIAPLARHHGGALVPVDVHASGTDVAFTEIQPAGDVARLWIFRAGADAVRLQVPRGVRLIELAGSLVAFVGGRSVSVRDWAGGAERQRHTAGGAIGDIDLAEDGKVLVHVPSKKVLELVDAFGSVHRVATGGAPTDDLVRLAGGQAVLRLQGRFEGDSHVGVIDLATGQRRRLSPSSLDLDMEDAPLDLAGELVAWSANGCVFAAPLGAPGSSVVPPGPCPRSEILLQADQPQRLQGRTARVRLRCITAPSPGCRGTVRLEVDQPLGKARFLIPAGRRAVVRVRLTRLGFAVLQREFRLLPPGRRALVPVRTTLADGARPRSATPHQGIFLRPAPR